MSSDLRAAVRSFIAKELDAGNFSPECDAWVYGWNEEFSRRLAAQGWVGMTMPVEYGGAGRSLADRYVVVEELLAAGAPVAAHWPADRQVAPTILRYGTEYQRQLYLPKICAGECFFAVGMSEPDAGSDLSALRTRADPVDDGWLLYGTKIWTSHVHRATDFVALVRTSVRSDTDRHAGLSQFLIDPKSNNMTIRPLISMNGEHNFNEVTFDGTFVPHDSVIGSVGNGWEQIMAELTDERSGPERFLSTMPLIRAATSAYEESTTDAGAEVETNLGEMVARLAAIRFLSKSVVTSLINGDNSNALAALVKDVGTNFEKESVDAVRRTFDIEPAPNGNQLESLLANALAHSPGFTLRGGTNEILRGIVARDLGLR